MLFSGTWANIIRHTWKQGGGGRGGGTAKHLQDSLLEKTSEKNQK